MSKEVSETLPPTESRELDAERLKWLLEDALRATLDVMSEAEPSNSLNRPVYRPQKEGFRSEYISIPYYSLSQDELTNNAIASSEVQALFGYLWDHGRVKKSIRPGSTQESWEGPTRESWDGLVFLDIIRTPLSQILRTAAINEAVSTGGITPWRLPDDALERVIDDLVWRICNGGCRYVARCLLASVEGEAGEVWELGEGTRLRFHTKEDRLKYLSQNTRNLPLHLGGRNRMWRQYPTILEIPRTISQSQLEEGPTETIKDTVSRQVGDAIDVIKWALMAATGQRTPLVEGEIFFECYSGGSLSSQINSHQLKRQDIQHSTVYDRPNDEELNTVRELLEHTPKVRHQSNAVDDALWHFGRSCLARLPRDQLLDAAIGLENLLICGHSSGYRLQLYGAAVMATTGDEAEALAERLKDVWKSRGKVAHTSQKDVDLAEEARHLLAKAVFSIMELVRDGELQPSQQNIPEEIQGRVLREVPFRAEDGG